MLYIISFIKKFYIIAIFLIILIFYFPLFDYFWRLNTDGGDYWLTADWLINYNFGFLRRGLFGAILNLIDLSTINLLKLISLSLIFLYILIIFFVFKIFKNKSQNLISYFLLLSPLFLIFPILNFRGGFRKELLGLTFFMYFITKKEQIKSVKQFVIFIIFYLFAIFSSEINLIFLPFLIFIIFDTFEIKTALVISKYLIYATTLYFFIYFYFLQSYGYKLDLICKELISTGFNRDICNGSIKYMKLNIRETLGFSISEINFEKIVYYALTAILGFLPFLLDRLWLKKVYLKLIFCLVVILPFYLIAIDWGRWHYILFSCITVIYFDYPQKKLSKFKIQHFILILIYSSFWKVNHYVGDLNELINDIERFNILYLLKTTFNLISLY